MNNNDDKAIIGPMIGMMMAVMMLSIIPGIVGAKPDPEKLANLEGTVYNAGESPPAPLGGVTVQILGTDAVSVSGPDGKYYFTDIPVGHYTIRASRSGYEDTTESVSLTEPGHYTANIFLLPDTYDPVYAHLSGTVVSSQSPNPAISGAVVRLYDGTSLVDETTTGPGGGYSLKDITPGSYTLYVNADGYDEKSINVVLVEGPNTQNVYLDPEDVPQPDFNISNLVVDPKSVHVGQTVNIGATVTNDGDASGTCIVSTDPGDDPHFQLTVSPETWSPALVPAVYRPAFEIDITPFISLMMVMVMMSMMTRIVRVV